VDGFVYAGHYALAVVGPGLMKVQVKISWERYGLHSPQSAGEIDFVHLVADPMPGSEQPPTP